MPVRVLCVNSGSSSLKVRAIDLDREIARHTHALLALS